MRGQAFRSILSGWRAVQHRAVQHRVVEVQHRTASSKPPTGSNDPTPTSTEAASKTTSETPSESNEEFKLTPVSGKPPIHLRPRRPRHPNTTVMNLNSQRAVNMMIDSDGGAGATKTGRSWRISELRLKSFDDLHKLWFILVRERDRLLMEKAWCKTNGRYWSNGSSNYYKIRVSMARVKTVVGERIRALEKKKRDEVIRAAEQAGEPVTKRMLRREHIDPNKATVSASGTPPYV